MDGLVTIIVPVYNTEKYVLRCLTSVQEQTYKNFECLIINDGSTDKSLEICEEFCKKDWRFKIISQENSGPSASRNKGLQEADGEFVFFLDSDDWVTEYALELLVKHIGDKNVCTGQHCAVRNENFSLRKKSEPSKCITISLEDAFFHALNTQQPYFFAWNKLFRKTVFDNIGFATCIYEDVEIAFRLFCSCGDFVLVNKITLFYNLCNSSSITSSSFSSMQMDAIKNSQMLIQNISDMFPKLQKACWKYSAGVNFHIFRRIISSENKTEFLYELNTVSENFKKTKSYLFYKEKNKLKALLKIIWFYFFTVLKKDGAVK
ncbi:glycosyl transferase family 2 [Treponema brennaborense DSM 12168]|uniref:Glycosyl transferase family 2 n=2 Tax=Treponema TaxID=157 RepID=F4LPZ5_TREBD|nr:glycosyl transferase family 2 [Treponema brennaborense DSM 12168]